MARAARIESSLAFNNAEFLTGIEQAEKRAQQFSQRTSKFVGDTFRKHGSAQVTLANFGENLLHGDLPNAIRGLSMGMAGIGLAAGVGVAIAADQFIRFKEHIDETRKAEEDLRDTLSRPTRLIVETGQAQEYIAGLSKQAEALQEKYDSVRQHLLDALQFTYGSGDENEEGLRRRKEAADAEAKINDVARERGRFELEAATARTDPTDEGSRLANFQKFDAAQRALESQPDKGTRDRLDALQKEREFATDQLEERIELRNREFETAKKLVDLERSALPAEMKKRLRAQMTIGDIDQTLAGRTLTTEQRQKLELQKLQQQADLRNQRDPYGGTHFGTLARGNFESQYGYGGLSRRSIESSLGFGGLARGGLESDTYKTPEEALLGTGAATAGEIAGYRNNVGLLPGENDKHEALSREDMDAIMQKYWGGN